MAEQKLTIVIGDHSVLSALDISAPVDGRTLIRVTSSCEGHQQLNYITLPRNLSYTSEQAEYDIEDQRHRFAEELASKLAMRNLAQTVVQSVTGDVPVAAAGRRLSRPNPGGSVS